MSLDDFYWLNIQNKKKGNLDLYKEAIIDVCGKELSWSEVKTLDRKKQIEILYKLDNKIKIRNSPYDIKKFARALQNSRSGAGGCAMTNFNCAFCGEEEIWSNTAVPKICNKCATKMAEKFVIYGLDIMKE